MRKNIFSEEGSFYKGNLHAHTDTSDGIRSALEVIDIYKNNDYNFLAVTDHNTVFKSEEYNDENFIIIPGIENHSIQENIKHTHHIVGITTYENSSVSHGQRFENIPWSSTSVEKLEDTLQNYGFDTIYCHPHWSRVKPSEVRNLNNTIAMEIYNRVCDFTQNNGYAEDFWDKTLDYGLKMWGMASDDCHGDDEHYCKGYIMVKAKELTPDSIINSIKSGSFYSSQGPEIHDFYIQDGSVFMECSPAKSIRFITSQFDSINFKGDSHFTGMKYKYNEDIKYIRGEVVDKNNKKAWTNPIFIE